MSDERTAQRAADLLPEERAAGSADPKAQAEAILADSDAREGFDIRDGFDVREGAEEGRREPAREERRSTETVTPGQATR